MKCLHDSFWLDYRTEWRVETLLRKKSKVYLLKMQGKSSIKVKFIIVHTTTTMSVSELCSSKSCLYVKRRAVLSYGRLLSGNAFLANGENWQLKTKSRISLSLLYDRFYIVFLLKLTCLLYIFFIHFVFTWYKHCLVRFCRDFVTTNMAWSKILIS